jgi:hypothetical protein
MYLHFCPQHDKGVARVIQLKHSPELIVAQLANLQHFQFRRRGAKVEFLDDDVLGDDRGHRRFRQRRGEEVARRLVKGLGKGGPCKLEGHAVQTLYLHKVREAGRTATAREGRGRGSEGS